LSNTNPPQICTFLFLFFFFFFFLLFRYCNVLDIYILCIRLVNGVDDCLSVCPFCTCHCIFGLSSIYGFWLPLWSHQTILTISKRELDYYIGVSSGYTTKTHHTDSLYNWSLVYDHTVIGKEVDRNIFALIQHPELQTNVLAILSRFTQFNHIDGNNYIKYDISHCT
jgi:hypothetical protein